MQVISFTEARNNLKSVLDQVVNDADCTILPAVMLKMLLSCR
ncbi:antitoxin YefM [Azomonas agilis]|uniref:Antitoxin YefM n=1 Tax=Azomonas agilis TaxID=116849 RepID=A0A562J102_9GAMM|nr:antitoxin YefM [Azomonas agilis]